MSLIGSLQGVQCYLFYIFENKGADQLRGNHAANKHLCFCFMDSTITLLSFSKFQASCHLLWLYSPVCV